MVKRSNMIGSLSSAYFALQTAKLDRSLTDFQSTFVFEMIFKKKLFGLKFNLISCCLIWKKFWQKLYETGIKKNNVFVLEACAFRWCKCAMMLSVNSSWNFFWTSSFGPYWGNIGLVLFLLQVYGIRDQYFPSTDQTSYCSSSITSTSFHENVCLCRYSFLMNLPLQTTVWHICTGAKKWKSE